MFNGAGRVARVVERLDLKMRRVVRRTAKKTRLKGSNCVLDPPTAEGQALVEELRESYGRLPDRATAICSLSEEKC